MDRAKKKQIAKRHLADLQLSTRLAFLEARLDAFVARSLPPAFAETYASTNTTNNVNKHAKKVRHTVLSGDEDSSVNLNSNSRTQPQEDNDNNNNIVNEQQQSTKQREATASQQQFPVYDANEVAAFFLNNPLSPLELGELVRICSDFQTMRAFAGVNRTLAHLCVLQAAARQLAASERAAPISNDLSTTTIPLTQSHTLCENLSDTEFYQLALMEARDVAARIQTSLAAIPALTRGAVDAWGRRIHDRTVAYQHALHTTYAMARAGRRGKIKTASSATLSSQHALD